MATVMGREEMVSFMQRRDTQGSNFWHPLDLCMEVAYNKKKINVEKTNIHGRHPIKD